ncbi:YveK family protein [Bacillus sp. OTU2372]|uniref:YveK family protein n=1 Tax=Bacillus sp. OTU2372 TaxID=3043858 RepID=UPI00313E2A8B
MEETIDLKEILQLLRKRLFLILAITIVAGILMALVSFFYLTPIYQSSTKLLINQTKSDLTTQNSSNLQSEVQGNLQLIDTYNEIIKSTAILDKVADKLGTGITSAQLNNEISIASTENSQVITIVVQDANAKQAAKIADTTAEVFQAEIVKIMKIDNVNILDYAKVDLSPIKPRSLMNIAIALVVGLMAGVAVAFLLHYFDRTLKTEKDIENELGLPVIGLISKIDESKSVDFNRGSSKRTAARSENFGS